MCSVWTHQHLTWAETSALVQPGSHRSLPRQTWMLHRCHWREFLQETSVNIIKNTSFFKNRCSYSGLTPLPWIPITLLITTMCPLFLLFISGRISFTNRTSPKKLVSITVFISPIDWHSMGPIRPIPALLTTRAYQAQTADLWRQLWLCGFGEDSKNKFVKRCQWC